MYVCEQQAWGGKGGWGWEGGWGVSVHMPRQHGMQQHAGKAGKAVCRHGSERCSVLHAAKEVLCVQETQCFQRLKKRIIIHGSLTAHPVSTS